MLLRLAEGIIGGYQPWRDIYHVWNSGTYLFEYSTGIDFPGTYYSLRRFADANPDPKTGENQSISTAYHMELVPAFAVPVSTGTAKTAQAN